MSLFSVSYQGFYQLLETKVTLRCRKQDLAVVQVSVIGSHITVALNTHQKPSRIFHYMWPKKGAFQWSSDHTLSYRYVEAVLQI